MALTANGVQDGQCSENNIQVEDAHHRLASNLLSDRTCLVCQSLRYHGGDWLREVEQTEEAQKQACQKSSRGRNRVQHCI